MARHGAEHDVLALLCDVAEAFDRAEIDEIVDARKPELECGKQRLAAGQRLWFPSWRGVRPPSSPSRAGDS
jgi:hypothetical protein